MTAMRSDRRLRMMVDSLDHLHKETIKLTDAARAGDLSVRGNEKAFRGGYRMIIAGFNKTLETITEPVNEAMRLAGFYASGDFTARFDEKIPVAGNLSRTATHSTRSVSSSPA